MPQLNAFAIASLITAISTFWIAAIVLIYGKTFIHRIWALFNIAIGLWASFVTLAVSTSNPDWSYLFWTTSHMVGIYVSIFFFHSAYHFCHMNNPGLIKACYAYGIIQNILNILTNGKLFHIGTNYLYGSMYYLEVRKLNFFIMMIPWICLAIVANYNLYLAYKHSNKPNDQKHAQFLLWGGVLGFLGGSTTFLPMYGLTNFYPITILGISVYSLINSYGIFRHQILELQVIFKKSIVYSFLIALITVFYLLLVLTLESIAKKFLGYTSSSIGVLVAFFLGILVIPIRSYLQNFIDSIFLKGSPLKIAEENSNLRQEVAQTEKLRAVATLASGLAHEIRNPLTAIQTFGEYLQANKHDDKFLRQLENTLSHETNRINDLIAQLLTFAKPSQPELKLVNARVILEKITTLLDHKLRKNKITLTTHFEIHPLPILADSNQLHQAFLNILLNAIDAMPQGGTLTISTRNQSLMFVITFKDTGYGIDTKDLKQIFDPFYSKKSDGTGLGLAITHGIIEQHKGKITVKSKVNAGTEFSIHLPVHDERGPHAAT